MSLKSNEIEIKIFKKKAYNDYTITSTSTKSLQTV